MNLKKIVKHARLNKPTKHMGTDTHYDWVLRTTFGKKLYRQINKHTVSVDNDTNGNATYHIKVNDLDFWIKVGYYKTLHVSTNQKEWFSFLNKIDFKEMLALCLNVPF